MHRSDDGGIRLAVERRGGSDNASDAGNFSGHYPHMSRGDERILAPGHVAANGVDRQVLMPQKNAWPRLYLDVS